MQQINIPRTTSNDATCILLEWRFENGQEVQRGDVLAYLETSKATEDLVSPGSGTLHNLARAGEEYAPGSCIGYLLVDGEVPPVPEVSTATSQPPSFILTREAQALVAAQGITNEQLASLGKKLLKKSDVLALVSAPQRNGNQTPPAVPRSRGQAIVAQRVALAHQTIPAAFTMIKVYCDKVLQAIAEYIEREEVVIGLAEVLIKHLGRMQPGYPGFYQDREPAEAGELQSNENPGIGITIDVGTGLYIPIIKRAATRSLGEIAGELMEIRLKALRNALKEGEMSGGHLTVSLHTEKDIVAAVPIIFPTQTCMISLCSVQEELYLQVDGSVGMRRYFTLGAAYDHRVINGAEAVQFLQEIKRRLEETETISE
jgi:2-oxoglutarate dehydrogenase E2 component (dihydrolipoamide succinyltransferase)